MPRRSPPRAIDPLPGPVVATVEVPGSKSHTNRALLIAALADGTSVLDGVLDAADTRAMRDAVRAMGAEVDWGPTTHVRGNPSLAGGDPTIDAVQSGTTARFILAALALGDRAVTLDGHPQLRGRPMGPQIDVLRAAGVVIDELGDAGHLPVRVQGPIRHLGAITVDTSRSSQFASGLMIAAPLAGGIELDIGADAVSRPYVELTAATMRRFGVDVDVDGRRVRVGPGRYQGRSLRIERDASTATYFWALAAATRSDISTPGIGSGSDQADLRFVEVLDAMGAEVIVEDDLVRVRGRALGGVTIDMADFSDAVPTLAAIAPFASGPTRITGVGFIRDKESDRVGRVVEQLRACGVDAEEREDGMRIAPGAPRPARVITHDDHRIAMAFTVTGLSGAGCEIDDPDCVAKTYPEFFGEIDRILERARLDLRVDDHTVIAIDGPAGSGKSTVARAVAERLDLDYLDTGAMYRAVAFAALRARVDPDDADAVTEICRNLDLRVDADGVVVDGFDATVEIRGPEVTQAVSLVAAIPAVRAELRSRQREWVRDHAGGVLEGRDIGSVVVPDASRKVYLTARPEVRAARRAQEVADLDYDRVASDIAARDAADQSRGDGPLLGQEQLETADVEVVDTSDMTVDQVVDAIVAGLEAP